MNEKTVRATDDELQAARDDMDKTKASMVLGMKEWAGIDEGTKAAAIAAGDALLVNGTLRDGQGGDQEVAWRADPSTHIPQDHQTLMYGDYFQVTVK